MGLLARIRIRTERRRIAAQAATSTHSVEPDTPARSSKPWSLRVGSIYDDHDDWGIKNIF